MGDGVVPGGGVALIRAQKALDNLQLEGDEVIVLAIVRRAVEAPLRQLSDNAGQEGALIDNEVKKRKGADGYNVGTASMATLESQSENSSADGAPTPPDPAPMFGPTPSVRADW